MSLINVGVPRLGLQNGIVKSFLGAGGDQRQMDADNRAPAARINQLHRPGNSMHAMQGRLRPLRQQCATPSH